MPQGAPYIFHGHDVSYFSGKVRPALPYKGLWYREVLPDILEIKRRTGLHYFPVLVTPEGQMWQDTSEILDRIERRHPDPPLFPTTPVQRVVAYLIELYGDEIGILPAMHYRWSFEESVRKVTVDFSAPTGVPGGGAKFAGRMKSTLPLLGVEAESIPAIEAHTRELLDRLCAHFEAHRYLLGDAPSLADCGLMGPMYGHLYRDAVPERLLYETAFAVVSWIERMNRPPLDTSTWLADDRIADSLRPVLETMADGVPMLVAAVDGIDAWAAETNPAAGEPAPPGVGRSRAVFRDATIEPGQRCYTLWMVQRVLDVYAALRSEERASVDRVLDGTGWEPLLALEPRHRLAKRDHALSWETRP